MRREDDKLIKRFMGLDDDFEQDFLFLFKVLEQMQRTKLVSIRIELRGVVFSSYNSETFCFGSGDLNDAMYDCIIDWLKFIYGEL